MPDGNRLVPFDGVRLVDESPIRQGVSMGAGIGRDIRAQQIELPLARCSDTLTCQTHQLLVGQGTDRNGFVECTVVSPKVRVQRQFHRRLGIRVAAQSVHQIHQRVGSFTVVKVLVHFVPELRQLFRFHKLQLYTVPLLMQILSKVQIREKPNLFALFSIPVRTLDEP